MHQSAAHENPPSSDSISVDTGIQSIPTLMVFRDKVLLFNEPGMVPKAGLQEILKQVRALDMAEVRRQIAEEDKELAVESAAEADGPRLIVEK